ncbi:MAG TPA: hypothetical protein VGH66_00540 [Acidimicrobiales bacterium]|jgi:hypothetical protein
MITPETIEGRHAFYAGWIAGIARKAGLMIEPVLIDGQVTDTFEVMVIRPGSYTVTVTVVVPPPPDDWHLDG